MADKILKNTTNFDIEISSLGITVPKNSTYDITQKLAGNPETDDLLSHISAGSILFVKNLVPEELYSIVDSVKLLLGTPTVLPKQTNDGEWSFVNENFGHLTGNSVINWVSEKYLDVAGTYSEKLVLGFGEIATLNFLEGGSATVPTNVKLEWFIYDSNNDAFIRNNPDINIDQCYIMSTTTPAVVGDTVIHVTAANNDIETDRYYKLSNGDFHRILSYDKITKTITLETGLFNDLPTSSNIGLSDRVIGQKGNQISNSILNWVSPPRFYGNGLDYLLCTITNEDDVNPGLITSTVNGWITKG